MDSTPTQPLPTDQAVRERYSAASQQVEPALCCPVTYDEKFLAVIPEEVINRDYGCGDPSPYVRPGDTVLDLGSGGGKLCFIISQQVGPTGKVIGVDVNPDMLELARRSQPVVAEKIGYDNIEFRCGRIQDLAVDVEQLASRLESVDLRGTEGALQCFQIPEELRRTQPMIADNSVDCVVSNCVLNLVDPADRQQLFAEIFRVLKPGGRAAISDIVSDEDVPLEMQQDPTLWSGCISGAWREDQFLQEFQHAGFVGLTLDKRQSEAWQTVNGIEFRSATVLAIKPSTDACLDRKQAVIYKGPFEEVVDDDGGVYPRGIRMAVCEKTFQLLSQPPYRDLFYFIEPHQPVSDENVTEFDCEINRVRSPRETKGQSYNLTLPSSGDCCGGTDCC